MTNDLINAILTALTASLEAKIEAIIDAKLTAMLPTLQAAPLNIDANTITAALNRADWGNVTSEVFADRVRLLAGNCLAGMSLSKNPLH